MIEKVGPKINRCVADGAYDTKSCYEACYKRSIRLITPPRYNAKISKPDKTTTPISKRNQAIKRTQSLTRLNQNKENEV